MIYFSTGKLRQKACFGPIRNLFSITTVQTENLFWKRNGRKYVRINGDNESYMGGGFINMVDKSIQLVS